MRVTLLLPAGLSLLLGLDAALLLLDLPAPLRTDRLPDVHGMLLVLGCVGTLVALERAVALGRAWGFAAPAALGAGGLALVSPLPVAVGSWLLVTGAAALTGVYGALWRRQAAAAVAVQALGAVLGTGAALLWAAGVPVPTVLPWLAGFLVLTIAGERVELARVGLLAGAGPARTHERRTPEAVAAAVVAGVVATLLWPAAGSALLGAAVLALVAWLARYDVARRTVRSRGLPRFMAACLLAGYAWLAVAAGVWLLAGPPADGAAYDALVHAVFLGFVLSMVMAHAPVILPAVVRRPLPYRPAMYAPAALLHASLLLRLAAGDARGVAWAWQVGGLLNVAAVLGFVAVAAWSATTARRPVAAQPRRTAVAA